MVHVATYPCPVFDYVLLARRGSYLWSWTIWHGKVWLITEKHNLLQVTWSLMLLMLKTFIISCINTNRQCVFTFTSVKFAYSYFLFWKHSLCHAQTPTGKIYSFFTLLMWRNIPALGSVSCLLMQWLPLQWRHKDGVLNHQPHHCLLNRSFSR